MKSRRTRSVARGLALIGVMNCGAPDERQQLVARTVPANNARESGRTASVAPTMRLPAVRPAEPVTDAVEARVAPSQVTMRDHAADPWLAFDGEVNTEVVASDGHLAVTIAHNASGIDSIRLRGPLSGSLTLLDATGTEAQPIAGLERVEVDIADGAWKTFALPQRSSARVLKLKLDSASSISLREVELWGRVSAAHLRPRVSWAEVSSELPGIIVADSERRSQRISAIDRVRAEDSGTFAVDVPSATACQRAFLRYSLDGAPNWSAISRSLNGSDPTVSDRPQRVETGGLQVEEISPALLRVGQNTVRFEPVRELGPSGYVVRNLSLVCAVDSRFAPNNVASDAAMLVDGENSSGLSGGSRIATPPVRWSFAVPSQAHAIAFRIGHESRGALELGVDGSTRRMRVALDDRAVGWHQMLMPDDWPVGNLHIRAVFDRENHGLLSELRVSASPAQPSVPHVVVTWPLHGECVDGKMFVRGYVANAGSQRWTIRVLGAEAQTSASGEFSLEAVIPAATSEREIELVARHDMSRISQYIPLDRCRPSTATTVATTDDVGAPFGGWVHPAETSTIEAGDVRIEVPRGAVAQSMRLTVRPLDDSQVPALNPELTNVTRGAKAYRLGPHPMRFLAALKLTIPVDTAHLRPGETKHDAAIYFYDVGAHQWRRVPEDAARDGDFVAARTDHFTDFIAATSASPEGPQGGSGVNNSAGQLGAGSPLAGMDVVPAPSANPHGTATTGLSIRLPPGRQGMQPSLSLSYDSSFGNGMLGVGWSMSISSIAVDTSRGVPMYRNGRDGYVLNGNPIVAVDPGCTAAACAYRPRALGEPIRITRLLDGTSIRWTVTDASGRTAHYGQTAAARLCAHENATVPTLGPEFGTPVERCGVWMLQKLTDPFGNFVEYEYDLESSVFTTAEEPWTHIYPSIIRYTGHETAGTTDLNPYYRVEFAYDSTRTDTTVSGRLGFLTRLRRRLKQISVFADTELVRRYVVKYKTGDFEKSLVERVQLIGSDGTSELYAYDFDYYRAERDGVGNLGFSAPRQWTADAAPVPFHSGFGNAGGAGVFAGVGDPFMLFAGGVGVAYQRTGSHTSAAGVDLNGDGLPDLFHRDGRAWFNDFRTASSGRDRSAGTLRFQQLADVGSELSDERSDSLTLQGGVSAFAGRGAVGGTGTWSWSADTRILTDVDADGRVDLINGPEDIGGVPVLPVRRNPFAGDRSHFGQVVSGGTTHNYTLGGIVPFERTNDRVIPSTTGLEAALHRTDPIVRWKASQRGVIRIGGAISVLGPAGDGVIASIYRVGTRSGAALHELLWQRPLTSAEGPCVPGTDGSPPPASKCGSTPLTLEVFNTDRLYFRVQSRDTIDGDVVEWHPQIEYLSYSGCLPTDDPDDDCQWPPPPLTTFDRSLDFRLADRDQAAFVAAYKGEVQISGGFTNSENVTIRIFRRRQVPRPGFAVPVYEEGVTPVTESLLRSLVLAGADTQVQEIYPPGIGPSSPLGPERVFPPGTHSIDRVVPVEARDQILIHVQIAGGQDPGALFTAWTVAATQTRACPAPSGATCYDVTHPCTTPHATPPGPGGFSPRMCKLLGAPAALEWLAEDQVYVASALPAVHELLPSSFGGNGRRQDPLQGWFRGWSVGEWNGDRASFEEELLRQPLGVGVTIDEVLRRHSATPSEPLPVPASGPVMPRPAGDQFVLGTDVLHSLSAPLWRGTGVDCFVTANLMKPSTRAPYRVDPVTHRIVATTTRGSTATQAPSLRAGYSQLPGVHLQIPGVGVSHSGGAARNDLDFVDVNGDGYPDSIRWDGDHGNIQLQIPPAVPGSNGSFSSPIPFVLAAGRAALRSTDSSNTQFSASYLSQGGGAIWKSSSSGALFGTRQWSLSGGTAQSYAHRNLDLIDINGDGLLDHVESVAEPLGGSHGAWVQYNLGYGFSRRVSVGIGSYDNYFTGTGVSLDGLEVRENCIDSAQAGAYGGGAGAQFGVSRTRVALRDLNGDGLPDRIMRRDGATARWDVQFNNGANFGPILPWRVPAWPTAAAANPFPTPVCASDLAAWTGSDRDMPALLRTWSVDLGVGFPIFIPLVFVGIQVHPTISVVSHEETQSLVGLDDIDGDGLPDHVLKTADDNGIWMRPNPNARANLLHTITSPTGVVTTLSYAREGNHVTPPGATVQREMPSNRWVLSAVNVSDPLSQSYTSTIGYEESGNYDRAEREFLGFGTVKVTHPDLSYTVTRYHNQDYYRRFTAYETIEYSATGNVLARSLDTFAAPPSLPVRTGVFFAARTASRVFEYAGTSPSLTAYSMETGSTFAYNADRLLSSRVDERELTVDDNLETKIEYYVDAASHIYRVRSVELFDSVGNSLRKQSATFFSNGALKRLEQRLVGGHDPDTGDPWIGSAGSNPFVTFDYDAFGNVRTRTDASGYTVDHQFDSDTRSMVEETSDSWGLTTRATWDRRFASPLVTTDANGHHREVRYDVFGRVKEVYGAFEYGGTKPTVSYEYTLGTAGHTGAQWAASYTIDTLHPGNQLEAISFVDGFGRTLQTKRKLWIDHGPGLTLLGYSVSGSFVRDALGRITQRSQPSFDSIRPLTTMSPALSVHPSSVEYDVFGRVHVVRAANGSDTMTYDRSYAVDPAGVMRRRSVATFARAGSPADGRVSSAWHDLSGNLRRLTRQNTVAGTVVDIHTDYSYDDLGRLVSVTDVPGRTTTAKYDSLDRMIELDDPDSGITEYQYLLSGELGARITPELRFAGQKIRYDYSWHRLNRIRYPSTVWTEFEFGPPGAAFNRAGRAWRVTDSSGSRELQFTADGEVSFEHRELVPFGGLSSPTVVEMSFEFDSLGRATSVTYPPAGGVAETVRYGYDTAGNLSNVVGHIGTSTRTYIEGLTYDSLGRRKRVTLGNGPVGNRVTTEYRYDDINERLEGIDTNTPFGEIQHLRYDYTAQGLVRTIKNTVATGPDRGPSTQEFHYDRLENLVNATGEFAYDDGSLRRYSLEMTYDAQGRTTRMNQQDELIPTGGGGPIPVAATSRDDLYVYSAGRRHQVKSIGSTSFVFDRNGNQHTTIGPNDTIRQFNWDEEDRLTSVEGDGSVTSFVYDGGGTRTHKSGSSGTTVYPNAFVSIRNGVAVTRHVYADGQRVSSVLSGDDKERVYWTHGDHLGTTQHTTAQDGTVHEHYEHLPFGESWVEQASGSDPSSHRFLGREVDQETGLQYVGARYYDARTTRWLSADPALGEYMVGGGVSDPRNLNTYTYVYNSPANYADPDGRQAVPRDAEACVGFTVVINVGQRMITFLQATNISAEWPSMRQVAVGVVGGAGAAAAGYFAAMRGNAGGVGEQPRPVDRSYAAPPDMTTYVINDQSSMSIDDHAGVRTDASAEVPSSERPTVRPPAAGGTGGTEPPEPPHRPGWQIGMAITLATTTTVAAVTGAPGAQPGLSTRPSPGSGRAPGTSTPPIVAYTPPPPNVLALGYTRGPDGMNILNPFAERVGARTVASMHPPRSLTLMQEIRLRLDTADIIHFNLQGINNLPQALRTGRRAAPGDSNFVWTHWEFATVIDNANLRVRTVFHLDGGGTVRADEILRLVR